MSTASRAICPASRHLAPSQRTPIRLVPGTQRAQTPRGRSVSTPRAIAQNERRAFRQDRQKRHDPQTIFLQPFLGIPGAPPKKYVAAGNPAVPQGSTPKPVQRRVAVASSSSRAGSGLAIRLIIGRVLGARRPRDLTDVKMPIKGVVPS
jgi:hypothetical protein